MRKELNSFQQSEAIDQTIFVRMFCANIYILLPTKPFGNSIYMKFKKCDLSLNQEIIIRKNNFFSECTSSKEFFAQIIFALQLINIIIEVKDP